MFIPARLRTDARILNYGFAQNLEDTFVDLSVIALSAVERIEVLKSGAAAIYGSDATAGVGNIILKQKNTDKDGSARSMHLLKGAHVSM